MACLLKSANAIYILHPELLKVRSFTAAEAAAVNFKRLMPISSFAIAERPDVRYSLVATDFLPPSVLNVNLQRMAAMMAAGSISPLQFLSYSFADVAAALRQFSRAQHVGKVVVHLADVGRAANSIGSWAVVGGLGALGTLLTSWMIGQGQHHLVVLGRTGR